MGWRSPRRRRLQLRRLLLVRFLLGNLTSLLFLRLILLGRLGRILRWLLRRTGRRLWRPQPAWARRSGPRAIEDFAQLVAIERRLARRRNPVLVGHHVRVRRAGDFLH